jgi:SAM-dependent methyltransferase
VYRGLYHAILHERDRAPIIADIREFILDAFKHSIDRSALVDSDKTGYTNEEYAWLSAGLPIISVKRLGYQLQRIVMKTLGTLSSGIALGWRTGFDSGQSLDYVYRNTPNGKLGVGKLLDASYLNSAGWRGIRQRKRNMEAILRDAIDRLKRDSAHQVSIVDIAGGPGRYVIDVVREMSAGSYSVLIRDWSEEGLEQGRAIARDAGLSTIQYRRGDAFSLESLAEIEPVEIAIVSGLYELFSSNEMVTRSLQGLAARIKPGGYLIYTGQPWHPQLEMIAEVLSNRDGKSWVMRRRTQAEMDELVQGVGFVKCRMEIDNDQIFTVSLAKKV